MLRTIQQIQKLKNENKKKWGSDLIKFCIPYIRNGFSNEEITQILLSDFNINISLNSFKNLRFRYYKITTNSNIESISEKSNVNDKQETENINNEGINDDNSDFDYLDNPKYIIERQKREKEKLFQTNKGAKW